MAQIDTNTIIAARNRVLQSDEKIAKTIYDIRGEAMGDKEVHEHVEKAINDATRQFILENIDDDDDFDINLSDISFDDDDFKDDPDKEYDDDADKDPDEDSDEDPDEDSDGDRDEEEYDSEDEYNHEDDDAITSVDDDFASQASRISDEIRSMPPNKKARALISGVGHHFELSRADYLDTIDALYKSSIESGTHRDTYNLLTFIKFVNVKDLTAAFAFLDIPKTDLSEVFSLRSTSGYITVDGMFYKSTFNNDSILSWPWADLRPSVDVFKDCPFDNMLINKIAGRKILNLPGIDSERDSEIKSFMSSAAQAIKDANDVV